MKMKADVILLINTTLAVPSELFESQYIVFVRKPDDYRAPAGCRIDRTAALCDVYLLLAREP